MWEEWDRKIPLLSRFWARFVIVLLLVIVIESYPAEHEHDYEAGAEVTLSTLAYISR
ncbi:MAG: hypothetical protein QOE26_1291 [Verrucomicrobiota bacterium]